MLSDTTSVIIAISWLILFYLAWPRLIGLGRRLFRRRAPGKPVRIVVPPAQPTWDRILERNLQRATFVFLGLLVLEFVLRRPQFARIWLLLTAVSLGVMMLIRGWRGYFHRSLEQDDIVFPQVLDNTVLGQSLLKVQELLDRLRQVAMALDRKGGMHGEMAAQIRVFIESLKVLLVEIRLEPIESTVLRQARSLFIRLEMLTDSLELLARLSDEAELQEISDGIITVLTSAKGELEQLRLAQGDKLLNQVDILLSVLRQLYQSSR